MDHQDSFQSQGVILCYYLIDFPGSIKTKRNFPVLVDEEGMLISHSVLIILFYFLHIDTDYKK